MFIQGGMSIPESRVPCLTSETARYSVMQYTPGQRAAVSEL